MSENPNTVEIADEFVQKVVEPIEEGVEHPHWHKHVAMTTLVMALLTAIAAMLAGMSANQSLIERTQEIIEADSLDDDRIQQEIIKSKHEILTVLGEIPDQAEVQAMAAFDDEIQELGSEISNEESLVIDITKTHHFFAVAATLLSLGTALNGMSVIVNRKNMWVAGLVFGTVGSVVLVWGVSRMLL